MAVRANKSLILMTLGAGASVSLIALVYKLYKDRQQVKLDEGFVDSPTAPDVPKLKVLVLGLNNSGKSLILRCLKKSTSSERIPATTGCNVVFYNSPSHPNLRFSFWEVGGAVESRMYWHKFIEDTRLLMYVVDSADTERFSEAYTALHKILGDSRLANTPILIVASKQDLKAAEYPQDVVHALGMDNLSRLDRHAGGDVHFMGCQVKHDQSGIVDFDGTNDIDYHICKILS